jgi:hypothetical protein
MINSLVTTYMKYIGAAAIRGLKLQEVAKEIDGILEVMQAKPQAETDPQRIADFDAQLQDGLNAMVVFMENWIKHEPGHRAALREGALDKLNTSVSDLLIKALDFVAFDDVENIRFLEVAKEMTSTIRDTDLHKIVYHALAGLKETDSKSKANSVLQDRICDIVTVDAVYQVYFQT